MVPFFNHSRTTNLDILALPKTLWTQSKCVPGAHKAFKFLIACRYRKLKGIGLRFTFSFSSALHKPENSFIRKWKDTDCIESRCNQCSSVCIAFECCFKKLCWLLNVDINKTAPHAVWGRWNKTRGENLEAKESLSNFRFQL